MKVVDLYFQIQVCLFLIQILGTLQTKVTAAEHHSNKKQLYYEIYTI